MWGDSNDRRKVRDVKWDTMMLPKNLGGVVIRNLSTMNNAFLMKMGWRLRLGEDSLWCRVIRGNYDRGLLINGEAVRVEEF